jgi:hypothetical protein
MRVQLTDRFCSTARAESQVDYFDAQVSGLALRVSRTVKSWSLHFSRPDARRARLSLGRRSAWPPPEQEPLKPRPL